MDKPLSEMSAEQLNATVCTGFICIELRGHFPVRVFESSDLEVLQEHALWRRTAGYTGPMQIERQYFDGTTTVDEV